MLRIVANIISWVFHPLLIVSYMSIILLLVNPYLFGVNSITEPNGQILLIRIVISSFFIPAFATVMLKLLGLVNSLEMNSREERYIPYIITGGFYLWLSINFYYNTDIPRLLTIFMLGSTISLFFAFFINLFSKISAHAVGGGGLLAMAIITYNLTEYATFSLPIWGAQVIEVGVIFILLLIIIITGLIGTARLLIGAHDHTDIYGGYMIGFLGQLIALRLVMISL